MRDSDPRTVRRRVTARLRSRLPEIESAIMAKVVAVSEPVRDDPIYIAGLREAVAAAVEHGLEALELGSSTPPRVPLALIAQARLAARMEVPLDTVLRRYFAGYTMLLDYVVAEARANSALSGDDLQAILRGQSLVHEHALAVVSEEYAREPKPDQTSLDGRRAQLVRRLLEGEPLDASMLGYTLEQNSHCGVVLHGTGGEELLRALATELNYRRLMIPAGKQLAWGWLGDRDPIDMQSLVARAGLLKREGLTVAFGQPAPGAAGWRLTHRQARVAMAVALRRGDHLLQYVDVALLASLLQDDLLSTSLEEIYLKPIVERDDGDVMLLTLRAYFDAGRNISSAAAALKVNRQTVSLRLRRVEERLGDVFGGRAADLEAALRLNELRSLRRRATP
jgi:hypothetical protein